LAKARRLLARRLARHGLALSAVLLPLNTARAGALAPELVRSTVSAAGKLLTDPLTAPDILAGVCLESGVKAMILKLKSVMFALLSVTVLGVTTALLVAEPVTEPLAAAEAPKEKKDKKDIGPTVRGTLQSIDAGKKTITLRVLKNQSKKEIEEKTYPLADDVQVVLIDILSKKEKPPAGTLADLTPDTQVEVQLSADGKSVVHINASGPGLMGSVKSFDPAKKTLVVLTKSKEGAEEKTLQLHKEAKIILDDGLGKKGDPPQEGKPSDLTEGTPVNVRLSVNRKTALGVVVHGQSLHGTLKGYDAGNRILTVTVKEDGLVDKELTLAKGARVEGDLTAGARVSVRLSIRDKSVAVSVHVHKDE
jgi:hypothetical protein